MKYVNGTYQQWIKATLFSKFSCSKKLLYKSHTVYDHVLLFRANQQ